MLSQAVAGLRAGRGTIRRFREAGDWGLRYSGLPGSGFHLILRGRGWLISADGPPVAVAAGDVVLVTSGADHGLSAEPRRLADLPEVVLGLDPPQEGPADFEFLCGAYRLGAGGVHPYLAALPDLIVGPPSPDDLRPIAALLDSGTPSVTWPALLDLILMHALRRFLDTLDASALPASDPVVEAGLRLIHEDSALPWTATELGRSVGLSRAAFTRRFTAGVGQPPMTYLKRWRLNQAARLLRQTDAPLARIAQQVGYSTEFAFGAAFRKEYATSPGRFRKAAQRVLPVAGRYQD